MENAFLRIKETGTIKWKYSVLLFALLLGLFSCTSYKTQYVGFRPAADYPNNVAADGLTIGVGGAVYGGAKEGTDPKQSRTIDDDLWDKGLEGKNIPDQSLANGFLFFPAEAQSARELRLQMVEIQSGNKYTISLPF